MNDKGLVSVAASGVVDAVETVGIVVVAIDIVLEVVGAAFSSPPVCLNFWARERWGTI